MALLLVRVREWLLPLLLLFPLLRSLLLLLPRRLHHAYVWLMDAAVAIAAAATAAVSTIASTVAAAALRLWLYLLSS